MKTVNLKTVLIVDDEPRNIKIISDIFEDSNLNYNIIGVPNGKTGLEVIEKVLPDLIITDWEMPEMNGIDFIKKLKQYEETKDIPIIMCTGIMTTSENLETALNVGAVDYIRKPIDKLELIARTKANLHLAEKYNEVKKLNTMKDNIFSVISHDLRGPVGTLKSFVDLILCNLHNYSIQQLEELIAMISKQSSSVYSTLENLLLWANSQRNNVSYQPVKQKIIDVVLENIALLNAGAENKQISLQNNIPDDLTATFDTNLISTVIRNLISNAIKFTEKGGIVSVNVEKGELFHTIIVSDTGIGIDTERINKIFDKTSYKTTFGTNAEKGSGLGLKLSLDFVEIHNGKIWVESEVGKGSKFCFTLPVNENK